MAEELPWLSDISSPVSLKRRIPIAENDDLREFQEPALSLSPPSLEKLAVGGQEEQSLDCALKKTKTSNEISIDGSLADKPSKLEADDESFDGGSELETKNVILELDDDVGMGDSCKNTCYSENQSVEFGKEIDKSLPERKSWNSVVTCSLKIEVFDGTALVDVVNVEQGKRKGNVISSSSASNGGKKRFMYSRKKMEALRFVNVKGQKKFWQQVYNGFTQAVKKEFDELGTFRRHQNVQTHQSAWITNSNGQGLLGESTSENVSCDAETISSADFTCDDYNNGKDLVGEWSGEEDSDDEYDNIQRPVFWVEGEPDFKSGPPEDGLEYLRRVRWEAAQIPQVKVAKIDNSKFNEEQSVYMPKIPDIEKCPPHLVPLQQWEEEFMAKFSELRLALSCYTDGSEPQSIFHPKEHASRSSQSLTSRSGGPTLSAVLGMDPVRRVTMLKRCISLFDSANGFSKDDCAWIFALCAAVDTPLDADTCASLRCLLRKCAKLRAAKSELDDKVIMLNVLATISGKLFGQLDG